MSSFNTSQKLALLCLYSEEISKRLAPLYYTSELSEGIAELLDVNTLEELFIESGDEVEFSKKLWESLISSPMRSHLYETILSYLSAVDPELHSMLTFVSEKDSRSQFSIVLSNIDCFREFIDVDATVCFLRNIPTYSVIVSALERSWRGEEDSLHTRKNMVLRTVPLLGYYAVYDLMRSIYNRSEDAAAFINRLYPGFLRYYELLEKERSSPRGVITLCPVGVSIKDVVELPNLAGKHRYNLNYEDLPPAATSKDNLTFRLLKSINERAHAENPILLRDYQKELCAKALTGVNTIIAAPTGCGKTIVAAFIIKNHLDNKTDNERNAKVLFMTPNTVILDQQAETLRRFLNHRYEVFAVRGSDNTPLRQIIAAKDVLVSTPQLIVNLLGDGGSGEASDVVHTGFELTTFTMMVFDECHSAVKNSPYAVLMRFYHRLKFTRTGLKSESRLPQIIGLTASLGVGGASNEVDATNHVIRLCACLDCDVISTVRKYAGQLRKFSPSVVDEVIFCDDTKDENRRRFIQILCKLMTLFEAKFYEIFEKCSSLPAESHFLESAVNVQQGHRCIITDISFKKAPEEKLTQGYLNWISNHLRRIVPEMRFSDESAKTQAVEILEILYDMYRATEMYQDFSTTESYNYIKKRMTSKSSSLTGFSCKLWQEHSLELSKYQSPDSALVSELVRHLCMKRNGDFRAIVFVRTRNGASVLSNLLNTHPDCVACGLRVESIAGSNRGEYETTTKREQVEKLKRFRNGETRVLVATSVADEGLDVAECNLVFKYNCASNEIAHVQRRGRGRAENSRSILLTQSVKLKEQEEKNVVREKLMTEVLCSIQENRINFSEQVRKAVKHLWSDIQREDVLTEQRVANQKSSGIVYKLLCSKCDTLLCTSKDVKTRNSQYCVCDPSFWSKTRNEEITDDGEQKYGAVAKLYCTSRNCQNSLGRVVNMEGALMPVLGASAFVLEFSYGNSAVVRKSFRKWKEVVRDYFSPEKIRNYDLAAMNEASNKPQLSSSSVLVKF